MGKVWVLDTETKGTGANMVPLERVTKRPSVAEPVFVPRDLPPHAESEAEHAPPKRFRIIDVMTRETLADDAGAREAAAVLRDVRSIVDVSVYVWQESQSRWQMLPLADLRVLWELAHAEAAARATE